MQKSKKAKEQKESSPPLLAPVPSDSIAGSQVLNLKVKTK